jgi:hypothetical protein
MRDRRRLRIFLSGRIRRVPTVFAENQDVQGLDWPDLIQVNYARKIGSEPTGLENPRDAEATRFA